MKMNEFIDRGKTAFGNSYAVGLRVVGFGDIFDINRNIKIDGYTRVKNKDIRQGTAKSRDKIIKTIEIPDMNGYIGAYDIKYFENAKKINEMLGNKTEIYFSRDEPLLCIGISEGMNISVLVIVIAPIDIPTKKI